MVLKCVITNCGFNQYGECGRAVNQIDEAGRCFQIFKWGGQQIPAPNQQKEEYRVIDAAWSDVESAEMQAEDPGNEVPA